MDLIELWRIAQVFLGIGLVIFVHEAGHFLAARWCDVRVDVFSLGFGPPIFSWQRGETLYQIAVVPLGGYVKMAGEEPDEEDSGPTPGDLRSKSVGQRFLIFSGGVIMNVLFGLVVFPVLFWVGVPFTQPLIGAATPGGPAWQAGLEEGTRVLEVNGQKVITFPEILNEVALGDPDSCELLVQRPKSDSPEIIRLTPERSPTRGLYELGFPPALDPLNKVIIEEGSPAALAGVATGDRWISTDSDRPEDSVTEAFVAATEDGQPVTATFESSVTGELFTTIITPREGAADGTPLVGVIAASNLVKATRGSAWASLGVQAGDHLSSIGGATVLSIRDVRHALSSLSAPIQLTIVRDGRSDTRTVAPGSGLTADDIALAADLSERRVRVVPRSAAAAAGLEDGDEVLMVGDVPVDGQETLLLALRAKTEQGAPANLTVSRQRNGHSEELEIEVTPAAIAPLVYGIGFQRAEYVYSEKNPVDAITVGGGACLKFLKDSWLTLKGIATDRVPGKNVGGPIAIGVIAHSFASVSLTKFFFFLCVLSMNLAFLNVLPIPLLDGGHLFFLLIEKLKGSPVSDKVMGYSQLAGLMLIGFIFVYIIYNDVARTVG
jgi:regulator of sigma E protease